MQESSSKPGRTWCAYCKRRGHSLYLNKGKYIVIVCAKSRLEGRCYEDHDFLIALFNSRAQLPKGNGTFLLLCRNLWELDERLQPNRDYEICLRLAEEADDSSYDDEQAIAATTPLNQSGGRLFRNLDEAVLDTEPYRHFVKLLEIYGGREVETDGEATSTSAEVDEFLRVVLQASVTKRLQTYLVEKQIVGPDQAQLKDKLRNIWFDPEKSQSRLSCAFERIFIGKLKTNEKGDKLKEEGLVSGIHNWVRFYLLEKSGHVQFRGISGRQVPSNDHQIANVEFTWRDVIRPLGSTLIGTTPAFEICLYTAAFLCGCEEGHTYIRLGSDNVDLYCPSNVPRGDSKLVICYPVKD